MTAYQFDEKEILIQPNSDNTGTFTFDLSPQLPSAAHIASIVVKSYRGDTESTSVLIDGTPTVGATNSIVSLLLKWPGADQVGKHKLTFIYTTNGGMVDEADFWCVNALNK